MKRCKRITRYSQFLDFGGRCWIAFYSSSASSALFFLPCFVETGGCGGSERVVRMLPQLAKLDFIHFMKIPLVFIKIIKNPVHKCPLNPGIS